MSGRMNNENNKETDEMEPTADQEQMDLPGVEKDTDSDAVVEPETPEEQEQAKEAKNTKKKEQDKDVEEIQKESNPQSISGSLNTGIMAAAAFIIGFMMAFVFYRVRKGKEEKNQGKQNINAKWEEKKNMPRSTGQTEEMLESPFRDSGGTIKNTPAISNETAVVHPNGIQGRRSPGIYVGKAHNIGRRDSQQDSFGMSKNGQGISTGGKGILAIVADGMGGTENGDQVSVLAAMTMLQNFDRMEGSISGEQRLLTLMNQANAEVNKLIRSGNGKKGGSTLVSVLVQDKKLYWLTVGDSRLCLYRKNALLQINREHVYGTELDEKAARGEISTYAAANDPQRKALTSYIGMEKITKIDRNIRPLRLEDKDRLLLMSDGVFGTLTDEEIIAAMQLPVTNSGEAIDQMIQTKNRKEQDNYTVLILEYVQE